MVWVAYHSDWSGFAIFATESEALRFALKHSMSHVSPVQLPCEDVRAECRLREM